MQEMEKPSNIPIINVAPYLHGSLGERKAVAAAVAEACEGSGFFCITGHGVDEQLISRTRSIGAAFFAASKEQKYSVLRASDRTGPGYYPEADRALAKTLGVDTPPDLQEAWVMGREDVPSEPYFREDIGKFFFPPNRWPTFVPRFRPTLLEYFASLSNLSSEMMGLFALALHLEQNFFDDKIDKATNQFRFIHYPPQKKSPEHEQLRAGAHTDYGSLTLLRGDDVPGTLQVKLPQIGWTDVRPPSDAFVCNIGDAMAYWTNGRWKSTLHRVANPPQAVSGSRTLNVGRITLVFFHTPNHDVVLSGIGRNTADQSRVTVAEHYKKKIQSAVHSTPPAA